MTPTVKEGTIAFHGYRTWYRVVGEARGAREAPDPVSPWRAGRDVASHGAVRGARRGPPRDLLRPAGVRELLDRGTARPGDVDHGALRRRGRCDPRRAGSGGRARAGSFVGRHARHGLRDHAAGRPGEPDRRELAGEHPVLAHGAREAARGTAGRRRGDAPRPRGGRDVRRSGIRRSHDGLLPQARVPDRIRGRGRSCGPWRGSPRTPRSTRS